MKGLERQDSSASYLGSCDLPPIEGDLNYKTQYEPLLPTITISQKERRCSQCGNTYKHPLHRFNDAVQHFLIWGCQTPSPPNFKDPKTALKLVLYVLLLPILGLLLSLYLVHTLMQEYYFDYKWVRFAFSKYPTPLWKRAISLVLVLIGLGLYLPA